MGSPTGLAAACDRLRARGVAAVRAGAAAELEAVVALARREWPRDTGRSATQLDPHDTLVGGALRLTGYAPFVRRAGSSRVAWLELIADRISPSRAGDRVAEEFRRG